MVKPLSYSELCKAEAGQDARLPVKGGSERPVHRAPGRRFTASNWIAARVVTRRWPLLSLDKDQDASPNRGFVLCENRKERDKLTDD